MSGSGETAESVEGVVGSSSRNVFAPLGGIRVVDLSRVFAGPFCTALLADLGAEVIKVEDRRHGDDARHLGPFRDGESVYFAQLNRSKKSVAVDFRDPTGAALVRDLAGQCDVLVENFRPGVADRLGVGYDRMSQMNPELIYVSISGFGQDGPFSSRAAYDLIIQAASGLMSITGFPDGEPTRVGESIADGCAGIFAAWATCAALFDRSRTGRGTHLDVSMLESVLAMQVTALSELEASGSPPGRVGNRHPVSTPFDAYRARDGLVVFACANDRTFGRLAHLIGLPEISSDARFLTDELRTRHESELRELIEQWTSQHDVESIEKMAVAAGVPCSGIWTLNRVFESEHSVYRRFATALMHPLLGAIDVVQQPVRFDTQRAVAPRPSPSLGEHTDSVLREMLGLSEREIDSLRQREIV